MLKGIIFALLACLLWGMIYVVPSFLMNYNAIEITFMRYVFFGGLSSFLFILKGRHKFKKYSLRKWAVAFALALFGHVLYYFATVVGLRLASPPVTILIGGLVPIVVAFYGNWEMKECQFSCLIVPTVGITLGMLLVNFSEIDWTFETESPGEYVLGLCSAFLALFFWSWYAVRNGRFLKHNPAINHGDWSSMLGIGTFFWVLLFLGIIILGWNENIHWHKYTTPSKDFYIFLLGTLFLGTVCAWGGVFFWNRASTYLPLSVAGPMVIFETIFGLTFVYLFQSRIPSALELIGVLSMLSGIVYIIIKLRKTTVE